MIKSVLFISLLFVNALCENQQRLTSRLVELNSLVGADHVEIEKLQAEMESGLQKVFDQFQAQQKVYLDNCKKGEAALTTYKEKLQEDLNHCEATITKSQTQLSQSDEKMAKANSDLLKAKDALLANRNVLNNQASDLANFIIEADQKLTVLKQLRNIATDELLSEENPGSFVQLSSFVQKVEELKGLMKKDDAMYAPLLTSLISLASSKSYVNQDILNRILKAIQKFSDNIRKAVTEMKEELDKKKETIIEENENIMKQAILFRQQISDVRTEHISADNRIRRSNLEKNHLQNELKRKDQELKLWLRGCKRQELLGAKLDKSEIEAVHEEQHLHDLEI